VSYRIFSYAGIAASIKKVIVIKKMRFFPERNGSNISCVFIIFRNLCVMNS